MNLELKEKRFAIAGSSRGIGLSIAKSLLAEGAQVWISGRDESALLQARENLRGVNATVGDLATADGRLNFLEQVQNKWKQLDGLIICLGNGKSSYKGLSAPDEEYSRLYQTNFLSVASLIRDFKPLLELSRGSSIVAISSIAASYRMAAPLAYSAAKSALEHFCISSAAELADALIRFNIVSPGNIYFEGGRWEELRKASPTEVDRYIKDQVPLGRFGNPEEVAALTTFLVSAQAKFCTGAVYRVDGGQAPCV
jgi:3-oxoacyl-[acyl-carrier protein] reductase